MLLVSSRVDVHGSRQPAFLDLDGFVDHTPHDRWRGAVQAADHQNRRGPVARWYQGPHGRALAMAQIEQIHQPSIERIVVPPQQAQLAVEGRSGGLGAQFPQVIAQMPDQATQTGVLSDQIACVGTFRGGQAFGEQRVDALLSRADRRTHSLQALNVVWVAQALDWLRAGDDPGRAVRTLHQPHKGTLQSPGAGGVIDLADTSQCRGPGALIALIDLVKLARAGKRRSRGAGRSFLRGSRPAQAVKIVDHGPQ